MCISTKYQGTCSLTFHWKEAHSDLSMSSELTLVYHEQADALGLSQAIILAALRGH